MTTQTKGQYRLATGGPAADSVVIRDIEAKATALIDAIEQAVPMEAAESTASAHQQGERMRLKALAQTAAEEAALWATKAVLKPAPMA